MSYFPTEGAANSDELTNPNLIGACPSGALPTKFDNIKNLTQAEAWAICGYRVSASKAAKSDAWYSAAQMYYAAYNSIQNGDSWETVIGWLDQANYAADVAKSKDPVGKRPKGSAKDASFFSTEEMGPPAPKQSGFPWWIIPLGFVGYKLWAGRKTGRKTKKEKYRAMLKSMKGHKTGRKTKKEKYRAMLKSSAMKGRRRGLKRSTKVYDLGRVPGAW